MSCIPLPIFVLFWFFYYSLWSYRNEKRIDTRTKMVRQKWHVFCVNVYCFDFFGGGGLWMWNGTQSLNNFISIWMLNWFCSLDPWWCFPPNTQWRAIQGLKGDLLPVFLWFRMVFNMNSHQRICAVSTKYCNIHRWCMIGHTKSHRFRTPMQIVKCYNSW